VGGAAGGEISFLIERNVERHRSGIRKNVLHYARGCLPIATVFRMHQQTTLVETTLA
jgi:hypothetical protein